MHLEELCWVSYCSLCPFSRYPKQQENRNAQLKCGSGVYTGLSKKPNLAWVIGHEATHLMVDQYAGHKWRSYSLAQQAIQLVTQHGGDANDIEESLALFMQVKLSQACGYTEATRRISDKFPENTPTGAILRRLEGGWLDYQANNTQDIIEYLLHQTIAAFLPLSQ